MDNTQTVKRTQLPNPAEARRSTRWHFVGLALAVVLALGLAILLGTLISSPSWENAVRVVVLGAVIVAVLMNPINGLLLAIILEPYAPFWHLDINTPAGIPDLSLDRLAIALLCVVWMAQLATRKRRLRRLGLAEACMVLFCIMATPALVAGLQGLSRTVQMFLDKLMIPFLVFVLCKNLYEGQRLRRDPGTPPPIASGEISAGLDRLTAALVVMEGYLCFVMFYELLTGQPLFYTIGRGTQYTRSLPKIVGLLGNPAFFGTILAMMAPMALYRFVRARSPLPRAFFGGMFALAVIGNFFAYNRGAWLALAVSLLILTLFEPEYRRLLLPMILIAAVGVAFYWGQVATSAVVTERLSNTSSISTRVWVLQISRRMLQDHLLFGVGYGNFANYYVRYGGYWEVTAADVPQPHNTYVLVLTTMGLVTLVPYLLLFLSLLAEMGGMTRRFWRERGADRALFVSGCAVIAAYMVSAVAIDLYANTFTSLVLFCITGTIVGHASHLRAQQRSLVADRLQQAKPEVPLAERA